MDVSKRDKNKMNRLLMIGLTPPLEGGSERHIYEISSRMDDCTVLTQKGSLCKSKVEIHFLRVGGYVQNISFFISALIYSMYLILTLRKKYDIIHIHENLLYFLVPFLKLRYKVIVTVHGIKGWKFYDNKFLWFFFRSSLKFANKIISVSVSDRKLLEKEFEKIIYIPNGVDLDLYSKLKVKKENKISFVGRIHEQKGLFYLFEAFKNISKKYKNYRLNIIGRNEGEYYENLVKKFPNLNVTWHGFILDRKEIFSELASSEILAFPSMWEALPWPALLEGVGSGTPVIASNLPGMCEIFDNGEEIILTKLGDSEDIAKQLDKLLRDKKMRNKIGSKGKETAKNYSWNSVVAKINLIYNELNIKKPQIFKSI